MVMATGQGRPVRAEGRRRLMKECGCRGDQQEGSGGDEAAHRRLFWEDHAGPGSAGDPTIGQFISVDPLLSLDQHQSLNGYSYAGNTPVTQSDPTGLCFADACGVGTPKGDGSGNVITDGPIDPGNPSAGSCHHGSCGRTHYNQTGTAPTSSSGNVSSDSGASNRCARTGLPQDCRAPVKGPSDSNSYLGNYLNSLVQNSDFWSGLVQAIGGGIIDTLGGGAIATGTRPAEPASSAPAAPQS
ncbi:RHS repeat-associated core domain-containing protein [Streptomyces diastatochromogenes]|uniref:RHS repeat-associated core domain-containing protein n=1 Tax=Streptomyces diastatochromogenes TaxID=42236 RepID=UPI00368B66A3